MSTYTAKIKDVLKETIVETNAEQLAVVFDVVNEAGEVVLTARHGFPLDTSEEDILAELQTFADSTETDNANTERNKAHEEKHAIADKTIEALKPKELKEEEN